MDNIEKEVMQDTVFVPDDDLYNKKIEPVVKPGPQIGIDLQNELIYDIVDNVATSQVDLTALQSFTNVSRSRNELYDTLDYMSQDTTLSSVLETYAEDATEMNDNGDIVWVESDDPSVSKYVDYLLKALNVNKNVFKWTLSLCKYGDVYLRLYRESEFEDKFFAPKTKDDAKVKPKNNLNESLETLVEDTPYVDEKETLNEDVNIRAYANNDRYIHYLEQADNPAQVFELTRFGKTAGYIKTSVKSNSSTNYVAGIDSSNTFLNKYRFNTNDVDLFPATEWVHGCLADDNSREPEEVELFQSEDGTDAVTYKVKKGQSLLYDSYKVWRELSLLENSVLLNRVTQSSIVRVIGVEVGDMPKEAVQPHLMNIKNLIEQKSSINVGKSMSEYTNPGPIVNNIYIPTRNNQGVLSTQQIGGDVNVGDLVDLSYYQDKLFGGLRVPKQYFGLTDDSAGFSGGQSLSIISSRYAKMIKRIQNVIIQMITDAINLILIDTKNESAINKFKIKMLPPTTQEEVDRRDNLASKVSLVGDIMNTLTDIENPVTKLKILKSLLSNSITDPEVIQLLQDEIDLLEAQATAEDTPQTDDTNAFDSDMTSDYGGGGASDLGFSSNEPFDFSDESSDIDDLGFDTSDTETDVDTSSEEDNTLPSPSDLDIGDLTDLTNPEI